MNWTDGKRISVAFATYTGLLLVTVVMLVPVIYMFSVSVELPGRAYRLIPSSFRLDTYLKVIRDSDILRMFLNSWVICGSVVIISLVLSAMMGYGLSRLNFRGKRLYVAVVLFTQIPPPVLLALSYFLVTHKIGLYNTYTILILLNSAFALPLSVIMLKKYFDAIPVQLDEAAIVDGCTPLTAFLWIILPVSWPGVVAVAMYVFLTTWKEYVYALTLTSTVDKRPITIGIAMALGQYTVQWEELMAISIWASLPVIIFFIVLQRYFIYGLTAGAVKQ